MKREKIFGLPRGTPLDRNGKVRVMAYATTFNAQHKSGRQHKGPLTRTTMDVLRALLWGFHNQHTGNCFPGKVSIAEKAGCCVDSVNEAIKALERAGVLTWCHRLKRVALRVERKFVGWRLLRTSNGYWFRAGEKSQTAKTENPIQTSSQESSPLPSGLAGALQRLQSSIGARQAA